MAAVVNPFITVLDSKRQPMAAFCLFASDIANPLTSDSQLIQIVTHLFTITFE